MKELKGLKVTLRPATLNDQRQIFKWLAESDTTSNMLGSPRFPDNPVPTWEEFINDYNPEFFNDINPYSGKSFIIEIDEQQVGHINYNEIDQKTASVELDIWLAGSRYCNKGYGTDAIKTLCNYLAEYLNCKTFILAPSARNTAAVKAYEKCGFQTSNELPPNFIPDYYDAVVMVKKM